MAILLASNVGNSAPPIAAMWMTDESHVRKVIYDFNELGWPHWTLSIGACVPAGSPTPTVARSSQ